MSGPEAAPPPDLAELEREYLTPVRQAINRAMSAHETYGAGHGGPDYPRRREAELSAEWERLLHFVQLALRRREAALAEARATIAWYADEANHLAHWDVALGQAGWVDAAIELDRGERARAYLAAHGGTGEADGRVAE